MKTLFGSALLLITLALFLSSGGGGEIQSSEFEDFENTLNAGSLEPVALGGEANAEIPGVDPWRDPESVLRAIMKSYPDRVKAIQFENEQWQILINDIWFLWSDGRMLPEDEAHGADEYYSYPFYPYTEDGMPELRSFTDQELTELEARIDDQNSSGIGRNPSFLDNLWDIYDYSSSEEKVKTIYLFGIQVNVHRWLLEDIARVEERIITLAKTDPELKAFVESISQITGHNWRQIASSSSRSYHSYGIAIDILPASYNRSQVYWLWARQIGLPWYNLPYDQRYMPPEAFINAFEEEGFIWGGKWFRFDTIHFEYRPEILELSRIDAS